MEVIQNLLNFKSSPKDVGALFLTRTLGTAYPFLPGEDGDLENETALAVTEIDSDDVLQKRLGLADETEVDNGSESPKDKSHSWVYMGTVGGAQSTTILGGVGGGSRRRKGRRREDAKGRRRRKKPGWKNREPWLGERPRNGGRNDSVAAQALIDLDEDLIAEASTTEASISKINYAVTSMFRSPDNGEMWQQRWAHLREQAMPRQRKITDDMRPFQAPSLYPLGGRSTTTTTTKRPNVFYGDNWIKELRREKRRKNMRRKRKKYKSSKAHYSALQDPDSSEEKSAESLSLKYVPVFPDKPSPYYKSVIVDEDGKVIEDGDSEIDVKIVSDRYSLVDDEEESEEEYEDSDEEDYYDDYDEYYDDYDYGKVESSDEFDDNAVDRMDTDSSNHVYVDGTGDEIGRKAGRGAPGRRRRVRPRQRRRRRRRRRRRKPEIHLHIQQPKYTPQPQPVYYLDEASSVGTSSVDRSQSYGAPHSGSSGVVIVDRDGYGHGGGGYDSSAGLLALLPLLVAGGLAAGLFFNRTNGVTVSNVININGTSVTNTFTPTNTATATNTNNDQDTITNTNTNTNNNNTMGKKKRKRRRKRDSRYRRKNAENDHEWRHFAENLREDLFDLLGTTQYGFYEDFLRSSYQTRPKEILYQMTVLNRKMSCTEAREKSLGPMSNSTSITTDQEKFTSDCMDRVVCEHLSEDHFLYQNNMILRAGEAFMVTLSRYLRLKKSRESLGEEVSTLMEAAADEQCAAITRCDIQDVEECVAIM